jgi:hypothetical protein
MLDPSSKVSISRGSMTFPGSSNRSGTTHRLYLAFSIASRIDSPRHASQMIYLVFTIIGYSLKHYSAPLTNQKIMILSNLPLSFMAVDPIFKALPSGKTFNVWRIENFKVVAWTDIGAFYTGDSYLIFWARPDPSGATSAIQDIFFWIGSESTPDESRAAALKATELDRRFGGDPTQHREVQYHESELFHKAFAPYGGIRYLPGGVPSGFKPVTLTQGVSLYQVKGRRNPILLKVAATGASLNHGDAFILTSDKALFLWIGKGANVAEKAKATQVLDVLAGQFKGASKTRLEKSATTPEFWSLLGGEVPIAEADAAGSDADTEAANVKKIFKSTGNNTFALIAEGVKATRDSLKNPGGILIIERGEQVIVYLPKTASAEAKDKALQTGIDFLRSQRLPEYYSVSVAKEGLRDNALDVVFA